MTPRFLARDDLAPYLEERQQRPTVDGDTVRVPLSLRDPAAGALELRWGTDLVRVVARVATVDDAARSAAAISRANSAHGVVGYRLVDGAIVFDLAAYPEPDGTLSSLVLDRLVVMARVILESTAPALRGADPRSSDGDALAYALDVLARERGERPAAQPAPWIRLHKAGREVGYTVVVDGTPILRRVLLDDDGAVHDLPP